VIKERFLGGLESLERGWREDIWMTKTPKAITPFSPLDQNDIWICCSPSCLVHSNWRDLLFQSLFDKYHGRKISGKNTLLDNLCC
jgi:hypothetical protein